MAGKKPTYEELELRVRELDRVEKKLKDLENSYRESEDRYKALIENIPYVTWVSDSNGKTSYISPNVEQVYGYTQEEVYQAATGLWFERIHPEDKERVKEGYNDLFESGKQFEAEYRIKRKDGRWIWLYDRAIRSFKKRKVGYAYGVFSDITERKKTEQDLRESEDRFRRLAENAKDVIYRMSIPEGRYEYVGPASKDIFGYDPTDFYNNPKLIQKLILPSWKEYFDEEWQKLISGDMPPFYEYQILDKNGSVRWLNQRNVLVCDESNKPTAIEGIVTDITERKQAEEDLKENERRIRALFDLSFQFIGLLSPEGTLLDVNQTALDFAGIEMSDVIGKLFWETPWWTHSEETKNQIREAIKAGAEGKIVRMETNHLAKDGTLHTIEFTLRPVFDEQAQVSHLIPEGHDISDRVMIENALKESQQQLDSIIKSVPDIIYRLDPEGMITFINDAVRKYGYEPGEMIGSSIFDYICNEDKEKASYKLNERRTGERGTKNFEMRLMPRNLDCRDFEIISDSIPGKPVFEVDAQGIYRDGEVNTENFIGTQGVARDITDRKRAEQFLMESERKLRSIFLVAPIGIGVIVDQVFKEVNKRFVEMTGYSRDELIDQSARMIYLSDQDYELVGKIEYEQIARYGTGSVETRIKRKDGRIINVLMSSTPINPDDLKLGVTFTVLDITERKQVEDALRKSEEKFRVAFLTNPDSVNINRLSDGLFKECNDSFLQNMGYDKEEVMGKTSVELGIWGDTDDRKRMFEGLLQNGYVENLEAKFRRKDGVLRDGLMSARIIEIEGEKCILSLTRDITEYKRIDEEREKLQSQLLQSQKMESVGRLAGGIAHDFNNMLSVILGHAELALQQVSRDDSIFDDLKEIENASIRSADLIRQLLAFARKQTVSPKILDLNETVEGTLKMLQRLIGEDIDLTWNPGCNLWPVKIDPSQIDQLLANLFVNAKDAIDGVGKVSIETANCVFDDEYCAMNAGLKPGEYVMLAISDDGCGMNEEVRSKIFEPFFTTKGVGQGTGLGLSTVYGIVKQNEGYIKVYSEPDHGTTFKIYLPRHGGEPVQIAEEEFEGIQSGNGETVLIVEDEPALLKMTKTILDHLGYKVLTADNPDEAVRIVGSHSGTIDLLVSDVVLPDMNGRELAEKLLKIAPDLKCLFMSGYTADAIVNRGVLDGDVHFIQKPFSLNDFSAKILEVLDDNQKWKQLDME